MIPTRTFLLPLLFAAAAATAHADEVRLHDGRVLVGPVTARGDTLEVTTQDGVVVVPRSEVSSHRTDATLRLELAKTQKSVGDTALGHLHLAIQARDYGLRAELWSHLDRCLELLPPATAGSPATPALQRRLDDFLAQLEPELLPRRWRGAEPKVRVAKLLEQLPKASGRSRAAAITALLAREPNGEAELRREARRNDASWRRTTSLAALLRQGAPGSDRFVLRTTVIDPSDEVRTAASQLLRERGLADAGAVAYLAPGLFDPSPQRRVRTAEAFADLGHPDAVRLLVLAGPHAGRALAANDPAPRSHAAFLNQVSYVRDFDVEIASGAFIADPKIDVLQDGSVLDVRVAGVEEVRIVRTYQRALRQLTGSDPGADPRTWPTWLQERTPPAAAPAAPAAPTTPNKSAR